MQRRRRDLLTANNYYVKKFRWFKNCVYCGCTAECEDHVFPVSLAARLELNRPNVRKELFQGLNIVPACMNCNSIANAKPFISIREKRRFIQDRLKRKYKHWLRHIIWDEEEFNELGPNMKAEVRKAMHNRYELEMRVTWPAAKSVAKPFGL